MFPPLSGLPNNYVRSRLISDRPFRSPLRHQSLDFFASTVSNFKVVEAWHQHIANENVQPTQAQTKIVIIFQGSSRRLGRIKCTPYALIDDCQHTRTYRSTSGPPPVSLSRDSAVLRAGKRLCSMWECISR